MEQVPLIARVYANPRVQEPLVGFRDDLVMLAQEYDYPEFELAVREWKRLVDADDGSPNPGRIGLCRRSEPRADRAHRKHGVHMKQNTQDLSWALKGTFVALQGA